jgi:alkylation response protein AidB-like acyl-CoA dehydrogenase
MSTPYLTDERKLFQESIHKFMRVECPREYVRECDKEKRYPSELVKKMVELGWWSLTLPEAYDGYGDYLDMVIFLEAVAYYSIAPARDWNRTVSMVGGTINRFGTAEQKAEILPKIARGEISLAFALSEAEAGSDAAAVRTPALLKDDHFVVNGSKMWITGALNSDYMLTVVRTDPKSEKHKGMSLLLIPRDLPGIEIRPTDLLGGHALRTCEIYFDDVKVPADRLVGELHSGWINLMPTLTKERAALAAMCVGAAQAAVDDAVKYAKERVQFGRPIGKFQAIQHKLVDMQIAVDAARLLTYQAGYLLSQGEFADRECSSAKVFASDAYVQVAVEGIQVLGGYGYSMEFDMQRHFRESKLFQIFGGTNEIQRLVIARQLTL